MLFEEVSFKLGNAVFYAINIARVCCSLGNNLSMGLESVFLETILWLLVDALILEPFIWFLAYAVFFKTLQRLIGYAESLKMYGC